jgi:glycosyltransferase involved in cell wall biosynthesis
MANLKICHVITGLHMGGAEMMLFRLLSATNRERYEPVVISLINKGSLGARIEALGIPVYTLDMSPGLPAVRGVFKLLRLVRQLKPAVLQGWMYHGNLFASLAGLFTRLPVVWGIHHSLHDLSAERWGTRAVIGVSRWCSRLPAATVYVSRVSADQHQRLGFRDRQRVLIPNGFDGDTFKPDAEARADFRAEVGACDSDVLVGMIARLHPMKDHGNLFSAIAKLITSSTAVKLILAGPNVAHCNLDLKDTLAACGLESHTLLLGERSDTARIMAGLDIQCVSSSHGEAFPMVVGEAMASGLPCVVTDVGDAAWLVGDSGLVVPPRDSDALATALSAVIQMGPELRRIKGGVARQRVLEHFSLELTTDAYHGLYEQLWQKAPVLAG